MFEKGKTIRIMDKKTSDFHLGTILELLEEDDYYAILRVQRNFDNRIFIVTKVKFISEEIAERFYKEHGYY